MARVRPGRGAERPRCPRLPRRWIAGVGWIAAIGAPQPACGAQVTGATDWSLRWSRASVTAAGPSLSATTTAARIAVEFAPVLPVAWMRSQRAVRAEGVVIYGGRLGAPDAVDPERTRGRVVVFDPPARPDRGGLDFQVWRLQAELQRYANAAVILIASLDLTPRSVVEAWMREPPGQTAGAAAPLYPPVFAVSRGVRYALTPPTNLARITVVVDAVTSRR